MHQEHRDRHPVSRRRRFRDVGRCSGAPRAGRTDHRAFRATGRRSSVRRVRRRPSTAGSPRVVQPTGCATERAATRRARAIPPRRRLPAGRPPVRPPGVCPHEDERFAGGSAMPPRNFISARAGRRARHVHLQCHRGAPHTRAERPRIVELIWLSQESPTRPVSNSPAKRNWRVGKLVSRLVTSDV